MTGIQKSRLIVNATTAMRDEKRRARRATRRATRQAITRFLLLGDQDVNLFIRFAPNAWKVS